MNVAGAPADVVPDAVMDIARGPGDAVDAIVTGNVAIGPEGNAVLFNVGPDPMTMQLSPLHVSGLLARMAMPVPMVTDVGRIAVHWMPDTLADGVVSAKPTVTITWDPGFAVVDEVVMVRDWANPEIAKIGISIIFISVRIYQKPPTESTPRSSPATRYTQHRVRSE